MEDNYKKTDEETGRSNYGTTMDSANRLKRDSVDNNIPKIDYSCNFGFTSSDWIITNVLLWCIAI